MASFTLLVCECFIFSFINGIFQTSKLKKLPRGMFSFIKNYTQMFMTRYSFLEVSENKSTEYLILIETMIMQCKCYKIYEGYIEFNSTQRKKRRKTKN